MAVITRNEFNEWSENSVTKALKAKITKDIQIMQDMLIEVDFENLKELQGRCKAGIKLVTVQYEDLYED